MPLPPPRRSPVPALRPAGLCLALLIGGLQAALAADLRPPADPPAGQLLARTTGLTAAEGRVRLARLPLRADKGTAGGAGAQLAGVIVLRLVAGADEAGLAEPSAEPGGAGIVAWAPWRDGPPGSPLDDLRLVFLEPERDVAAEAAAWSRRPDVLWAEPYHTARLTAVPDDPYLYLQAHLSVVEASAAWDLLRGEDAPVAVAVVDGGMQIDHPDLAANVLLNPGDPANGVDDDGNGYVDDTRGWNFATGTDDPGILAETLPVAVRHGTHVAGIVAAVTDNGVGVAGATWNGPVLCIAANHATDDDNVVFGYQGLLYAAERGARVINCSWGRPGSASLLEMAVLERVTELGAVVVAAAGNEGNAEPFYPAAYPRVLAVANVLNDGRRNGTSSVGRWVDLAAPGTGVFSLFLDGQIGPLSGTSMAAPLVAAGAALVWGREPGLSGQGVQQRLRVAARSLDALNPGLTGLLGNGLLDLEGALSHVGPGYVPIGVAVADEDGDGLVEPGEILDLEPAWRNVLDAGDEPVRVRLATAGAVAEVLSGEALLAPLPAGGSGTPDRPFRLRLDPGIEPGSRLILLWELTGASGVEDAYRDRQADELTVAPLYVDLADGELRFSLGGNGRIGFAGLGGGNGRDGLGVRYVPAGQSQGEGPLGNLLFEGAFLLADGPQRISDAARREAQGAFDADFLPAGADATPRPLTTVRLADGTELARAGAAFRDRGAPVPLGLAVSWQALAPLRGDPSGVSWLLATVRNEAAEPLDGLQLGFFLDWDLNGGGYFPSFRSNSTALAPTGDHALVHRPDQPEGKTVATALVVDAGVPTRFRAITNNHADPANPSWGVYDGFTDEEKWDALTDGNGPAEALATDVSQFWAAGPYRLAPGDSLRCVLVLAAGLGQEEASAHAAGGMEVARTILVEQNWHPPPLPFRVGSPAPNPWNGLVSVDVAGDPTQPWRLEVFDLRGRRIHASGPILAGAAGRLAWDGRDAAGVPVASGTYLLRVVQAGRGVTRKICLVR